MFPFQLPPSYHSMPCSNLSTDTPFFALYTPQTSYPRARIFPGPPSTPLLEDPCSFMMPAELPLHLSHSAAPNLAMEPKDVSWQQAVTARHEESYLHVSIRCLQSSRQAVLIPSINAKCPRTLRHTKHLTLHTLAGSLTTTSL